ncbi:TPA: hypothetical protein ACPSKY_002444 [Legionella bozemanae]|uniref:hypothetical protein n=1 Tax=Legionella longbeachae TaxID=450 RepID=UPI001405399D|nr:hypothetical protein [Legionella longbeachae]QIN31433.1 hypothetical protein GCB94_04405 [Legionella longbeachae]
MQLFTEKEGIVMWTNISNFFLNNIVGFIGIFFSWLFTYKYYKKSLNQQATEANKEIINLINQSNNQTISKQYLIEQAVTEYLKKGTPVNFIDSLAISNEEKAEIYDTAVLRGRGRAAKNNPYR